MRLKLPFACYLLLLICSVPRHAQCQEVDGVYRGTLGKQEIVLEIGVDPEHKGGQYLVGRYFYRRHGIGIFIKGTRTQDGSFLLAEESGAETHIQWMLKFHGNATSGSFCKCDLQNAPAPKLVPIYLKRVSSDFDANFEFDISEESNALLSHQAYSELLLDFPLTAGPEVATKNGYAYSMIADPRFSTSMPRITKFPDATAMAKINVRLHKELTKFRLEAAHCLQEANLGSRDFEISTRVELFSRHLLSVVREGGYYCGGPHPDNDFRANTYDLDSGTETPIEYLLARETDPEAVKKLIKDDEAAGKDAISRLLAELYLQHATPEEECRDVINRESADTLSFTTYLSESGVVIVPDLPHVVSGCADQVVIPYNELSPLLKKNSQFLTLVETAR